MKLKTMVDARYRIWNGRQNSERLEHRNTTFMTTKQLMKFLFGETHDLREKQIRHFLVAVGGVLILCTITVVAFYLSNRPGHF